MELNQLYNFVLLIGMVGIILGVTLVILGQLSRSSGITASASSAVNSTITSLTPISSTWLPLIVTVAVLGIVLGIVLSSFSNAR